MMSAWKSSEAKAHGESTSTSSRRLIRSDGAERPDGCKNKIPTSLCKKDYLATYNGYWSTYIFCFQRESKMLEGRANTEGCHNRFKTIRLDRQAHHDVIISVIRSPPAATPFQCGTIKQSTSSSFAFVFVRRIHPQYSGPQAHSSNFQGFPFVQYSHGLSPRPQRSPSPSLLSTWNRISSCS